MSERLEDIAAAMVADGKGILAADESSATIKKRFDTIGLESTADNRRDYREMFFRADEAMRKYISGVILYDETLRQTAANGTPLVDIIRRPARCRASRSTQEPSRLLRIPARPSPKASMACVNGWPNTTSSAHASPNGAA